MKNNQKFISSSPPFSVSVSSAGCPRLGADQRARNKWLARSRGQFSARLRAERRDYWLYRSHERSWFDKCFSDLYAIPYIGLVILVAELLQWLF